MDPLLRMGWGVSFWSCSFPIELKEGLFGQGQKVWTLSDYQAYLSLLLATLFSFRQGDNTTPRLLWETFNTVGI